MLTRASTPPPLQHCLFLFRGQRSLLGDEIVIERGKYWTRSWDALGVKSFRVKDIFLAEGVVSMKKTLTKKAYKILFSMMVPHRPTSSFNRRGFLKTSVLAATSLAILSAGTALANPASGSGSGSGATTHLGEVVTWKLRVFEDPHSGALAPGNFPGNGLKPEAMNRLMAERANGTFSDEADTNFDPIGPGDGDNSRLWIKRVTSKAPKEGDEGQWFEVCAMLQAALRVNGSLVLKASHIPPRIHFYPRGRSSRGLASFAISVRSATDHQNQNRYAHGCCHPLSVASQS